MLEWSRLWPGAIDPVGVRVTVLPPSAEPLLRVIEVGARVTPDIVFSIPPPTTKYWSNQIILNRYILGHPSYWTLLIVFRSVHPTLSHVLRTLWHINVNWRYSSVHLDVHNLRMKIKISYSYFPSFQKILNFI